VGSFGELETERILHEHNHERCDVSKATNVNVKVDERQVSAEVGV
jgi:hypothetical protein